MLNTIDHIIRLSNLLYPNGRAFKTLAYGWKETLHTALGLSETRAFDDATSTLDSAIPDNDNFTAEDATAWEKRYGITTNNTDLATRKMAIIQKMNYPGLAKARGNYRFIQKQLRDAGFDVYVYENRFPDGMGGYVTQDPITLSGFGSENQYGDFEYGESDYGPYFSNIVANFIDEERDNNFNIGGNLRSTFFIGGSPIGTDADIDINRKEEFRHMILRLKPTQTVAFLFINYV
jgi:uncharacterized protein YmfQ (DUF2313 family)